MLTLPTMPSYLICRELSHLVMGCSTSDPLAELNPRRPPLEPRMAVEYIPFGMLRVVLPNVRIGLGRSNTGRECV